MKKTTGKRSTHKKKLWAGQKRKARDFAEAIDHKWAYSFFQAGYVTLEDGKWIHIKEVEKTNMLAYTWYLVKKDHYCRYDSEQLFDFAIRINSFLRYMMDHPDDHYYRYNPAISTARNALDCMIHHATNPYNLYDKKTIDKQAYLEDRNVLQQQHALYRFLGGRKRWNCVRKAQRIFWPKEKDKRYPRLFSSKRLEAYSENSSLEASSEDES